MAYKKKVNGKTAEELHEGVPPNWYYRSLKEDLLQRYWHSRRFSEVKRVIEPADKILDIGCADGVFTNVIAKRAKAKSVVGIDVLKSSILWASKHWKNNKKLKFKVANGHKLDFASGIFDAVFALEVLEHVFEPEKVLREIKRVLKKGGYGVFLVPSENLLFKVVWFLWKFYGRMVWTDTHVQKFDHSSLTSLCKKVGFKVEVDKKFILGMLHLIKVRKS